MASFQAKINWKRPRKRKNVNYRSVRSYTTRNTNFQKNSKTNQKIKQFHCGFISCQNRFEKAEKEKKYKLSFHSIPTRPVIENSKKIGKNSKSKKIPLSHHFKPKFVGKCREREKIKIFIPFRSVSTLHVIENSKKIEKTKQYHYGIISSQNWL